MCDSVMAHRFHVGDVLFSVRSVASAESCLMVPECKPRKSLAPEEKIKRKIRKIN